MAFRGSGIEIEDRGAGASSYGLIFAGPGTSSFGVGAFVFLRV